MTTIELLGQLRALDVHVWAEGGQLRCRAPRGALTASLEQELRDRKAELLEFLRMAREASGAPDIPCVARTDRGLPLSFGQRRLWFLDRMNPGNPAYNIFLPLALSGRLEVAALRRALSDVVQRHEALRTILRTIDGAPVQIARPASAIDLPTDDLRLLPVVRRRQALERLAREEARRPFDLAAGPLYRSRLVRLDESEHVLCWTMHHIIGDGWSLGVLVRDLAVCYNAARAGQTAVLPVLPIQYADYAVWQQTWLDGPRLASLLDYWRRHLPPGAPLDLPTDRPRSTAPAFQGARHRFTFDRDLHRRLLAFSRSQDVTPFMTLLAVLFVLLARRSGQDEIVIGSPIANRTHPLTHPLIGFFVNTLALRGDLSANPPFLELLQQVKQTALGAYEHQDLPFERFVETTRQARDLRRNPVFDVMLAYQNVPLPQVRFAGLAVRPLDVESTLAKFDLLWDLFERDGVFVGRIQYRTDLYDRDTVARIGAELRTLIDGILAGAHRRVRDLPLLDAAEARLVMALGAGPATPEALECDATGGEARAACAGDACGLHLAMDEQAARTPDVIAVVAEDGGLTYTQLRRRANALARRLRQAGVGPETCVALWATRTTEMMVGVLGIWKAGGVYVPIDPTWPQERIDLVLADTRPPVCIAPHAFAAVDPASDDAPAGDVPAGTWPASAAYVIYTSGSTGRPNGVIVSHGPAMHLIVALNDTAYRMLPPGPLRVGLNGPWVFDTTIKQILQLANGGTLYLLPDACRADAAHFLRYVRAHRIDVVDCTPSQVRLLIAAGVLEDPSLGSLALFIGGEAIDAALWKTLAGAVDRVCVNLYGPTECTVDATLTCISPSATAPTIGRPLPDVRIHAVDRDLHPCPIGVAGEAWIAGAGVARGYLRNPALTADRFRPDPFASEPGARVYRTGDRVRCRATGDWEYLGRMDEALKIRGFRIEPQEIEAALSQHAAVRAAAVVAHAYSPADVRLVAYVLPADGQRAASADLRRFLRGRLPGHLVPSAYVALDAFPLTAHGKLDRRALPPPERSRDGLARARVPPRDVIEWQIAGIWASLLGVDDVGVADDFFELGGHSLLAMVMLGRVKQALGCDVSIATLFRGATIEQLAAHVRLRAGADADDILAPIRITGSRPPFFCVHPVGGHVLCYLDLARALGDEQPFYGLQAPRGRAGGGHGLDVEALAARYLDAIRTVQPEGPYWLGGWSLGGQIAFEMARQLQAAREDVALLALIDSHAEHPSRSRAPSDDRPLRRFADDLFARTPDGLRDLADSAALLRSSAPFAGADGMFDALHAGAAAAGLLPPDSDVAQLRALFEMFCANLRAESRYRPAPSSLRVLLLQAAGGIAHAANATFGWERLARGGVERCVLPGDHYSLLRRPDVAALASELGRRLAIGAPRPAASATHQPRVSSC